VLTALRWSTGFIAAGVSIALLGFAPLAASGVDVGPLENAASFFAIGILLLLVGLMLRKLRKMFD
jgi:hypothetical protein